MTHLRKGGATALIFSVWHRHSATQHRTVEAFEELTVKIEWTVKTMYFLIYTAIGGEFLYGNFCIHTTHLRHTGPFMILEFGIYTFDEFNARRKLEETRIDASRSILVRTSDAYEYELVAAIEHIGSEMNGGHYVAYRRTAAGF